MPSFLAQKCEQLYHKLAIIYPSNHDCMLTLHARELHGQSWLTSAEVHVEMVDGLFNIEYIVYYFTTGNLDKIIILAEMLRSIFIPD